MILKHNFNYITKVNNTALCIKFKTRFGCIPNNKIKKQNGKRVKNSLLFKSA